MNENNKAISFRCDNCYYEFVAEQKVTPHLTTIEALKAFHIKFLPKYGWFLDIKNDDINNPQNTIYCPTCYRMFKKGKTYNSKIIDK